jgi:hypothetical protein
MAGGFLVAGRTASFKRDFDGLPENIQRDVVAAIQDLGKDPVPASRRFHSLKGVRPKVFTVDVTTNKAYKMSFEIDGSRITLRRVGTHKQIDRAP